MSALASFEDYRQYQALRLREWREGAGLAQMSAACLLFVALMALAAQLRLLLPFSPVPFTGQVLVVLMAGFVLGRYGAVSMGMYLMLGSSLGWFSGMAGLSALTGVTGGYLLGFVLAAFLIGELAHRREAWSMAQIVAVLSLGIFVIYLLGSAWLGLVLGLGMLEAVMIGVLPFLAVDAIKLLVAASLAHSLTPRRN